MKAAPISEARNVRAQFRDKIVVIGHRAGLFDLRSSPLDPATAGLLIHVNAIDNLLSRRFNSEVSLPLFAALVLLIAAALGESFTACIRSGRRAGSRSRGGDLDPCGYALSGAASRSTPCRRGSIAFDVHHDRP
jgi:CHASE2 domain-containing sensor protein